MIRFTATLELVRETMNIINENGYHSLEIFALEKNHEGDFPTEGVIGLNYRGYLMYNGKKLSSTFKVFSNLGELIEGKEYDFIFNCITHRLTFPQFAKAYEVLVNFLKERANGQEYILQGSSKSGDSLQGHSSLDQQPSEEGEFSDGEFHDNP